MPMAALTDLDVATLMVDHLRPGGRLLTYSGSYAYDVAERDVGKLVTAGASPSSRCSRR